LSCTTLLSSIAFICLKSIVIPNNIISFLDPAAPRFVTITPNISAIDVYWIIPSGFFDKIIISLRSENYTFKTHQVRNLKLRNACKNCNVELKKLQKLFLVKIFQEFFKFAK